eukprot:CAMPEP_0116875542 /NCGR_PEP_ID=MMETSP0463-20121206/7538_1 /TAXON_ID=181622 /ORGANISM="Strombidinopsis sp, Strain SopsisLIS2011" /LENGTH=75 /DNA_ID=CAMNT_0004521359 /DNA_START=1639 /DNA_END=1866 /DNA_ORIENTATION=-
MQIVEDKKADAHKEEESQHLETIKKLKGEIKRLRQELIMKPANQRRNMADDSDDQDDDYGLDEEEKAALRMLSPE